jgi:hypothetical protein
MSDLSQALLTPGVTYEECMAALEANGWERIAAGDWSWVFADPSGTRVARVAPWDPAYEVFIELCLELRGNRYVPEVFEKVHLAYGGHLTVIGRLEKASTDEARKVMAALQRREEVAGDSDLLALALEAQRVDERTRATIPFWRGIDDNPHNVMQDASGQLTAIDLFYISGFDLRSAICEDATAMVNEFGAHELWNFSESPFHLREPEKRAALRQALLAVGPDPRGRSY